MTQALEHEDGKTKLLYIVQNFANRGCSHRLIGATSHIKATVWLYRSPIAVGCMGRGDFLLFFVYFLRARVCWPPLCIFERRLDWNPGSCRSKQARYQLSPPFPSKLSHPYPSQIFYLPMVWWWLLHLPLRIEQSDAPGCICSCRIKESPWLQSLRMQHAFYRYQEEARADSYRSLTFTSRDWRRYWTAANNNLLYLI